MLNTNNTYNNNNNGQNDRVFEINGKVIVKKTMWTKGGTEFMNGATFNIESTHGCYQQIINRNVCIVNSKTIIFISGKHLVIQDILTQKQTILMKNLDDPLISSMNFYQKYSHSPIKIALGFKSIPSKPCQAKVYFQKKNQQYNLVHHHLPTSSGVIDISFIFSSKKLITIASVSDKEYWASVWLIKKEEYIIGQKVEFEMMRIIPSPLSHEDSFFTFNSTTIYLWHLDHQNSILHQSHFQSPLSNALSNPNNNNNNNNNNKINPSINQESIIALEYIQDTPYNAIITNFNLLYFSKTNNLLQKINLLKALPNSKNSSCKCITPIKRGFAIGFGGDFNGVHIYRMDKVEEELKFEREIKVERDTQNEIKKKQEIESTIQLVSHPSQDTYLILTVIFNLRHSSTQQYKNQQKNLQKQSSSNNNNNNSDGTTSNNENNNNSNENNQITIQTTTGNEENNKITTKQPKRIDFLIYDFAQLNDPWNYKYYQNNLVPVFNCGVLKGGVVDMGVCSSKNIIVVISEDRKFMVFQYTPNLGYKCIYIQIFSDQLYSVSIHPLFVQVAIALKEELKVLYLVDSELNQVYSELTKQCFAVKYNSSGNLLAAANNQNICVYNPYSFQIMFILNSPNSSAINQLRWFNQDTILVSSCVQGTLQSWNIPKRQKMIDHVYKQSSRLTAIVYDPEYDLVVRCSVDHKLKIFTDKGSTLSYDLDLLTSTFTYAYIIKEMNVILFGTNVGTIRMYLWPFDLSLKAQEFLEIPIHQGEVRCVSISKDYQYLISSSSEGDIYFTKMREYQDGVEVSTIREYKKNLLQSYNQLHNSALQGNTTFHFFLTQESHSLFNRFFDFHNHQLISSDYYYMLDKLTLSNHTMFNQFKNCFKEYNFTIHEIISEIDDQKINQTIQNKDKLLIKTQEQQNVLDEKNNMFEDEKYQLKQKLSEMQDQIKELQMDYQREHQKIENQSNQQLLSLYSNYSTLLDVKNLLLSHNHDEKQKLEQEFQMTYQNKLNKYTNKIIVFLKKQQQKIKQKNENRYNKEEQKYTSTLTQIRINQKELEEIQKQEAEEFTEYLDLIKQKLIREKSYQIQLSEDLRTSNTKYSKAIEGFLENQTNGEKHMRDLKYQIENQKQGILVSKNSQAKLQVQLKEKECTINCQEQEIQTYRYKNQHLQNYRTVYDYKVQILQDEQDTLISHLSSTEKKIKDVYKDLLSQANQKKKLDMELHSKNLLLEEKKIQLKKKKELLMEFNYKISSFQHEINEKLRRLDFENWQSSLHEIQERYFEKQNNVIEQFMRKNENIGWKDMKLTEKIAKNKIIIQDDEEEIAQLKQEEILLKDVNQLNKKVKILNNQLNNKSNQDNNVKIQIKDQHDQAHDQNLFLLNECNKLVEERTQLREDLQQMIKTFELIQQEIEMTNGDQMTKEQLDIYQIIQKKQKLINQS